MFAYTHQQIRESKQDIVADGDFQWNNAKLISGRETVDVNRGLECKVVTLYGRNHDEAEQVSQNQ